MTSKPGPPQCHAAHEAAWQVREHGREVRDCELAAKEHGCTYYAHALVVRFGGQVTGARSEHRDLVASGELTCQRRHHHTAPPLARAAVFVVAKKNCAFQRGKTSKFYSLQAVRGNPGSHCRIYRERSGVLSPLMECAAPPRSPRIGPAPTRRVLAARPASPSDLLLAGAQRTSRLGYQLVARAVYLTARTILCAGICTGSTCDAPRAFWLLSCERPGYLSGDVLWRQDRRLQRLSWLLHGTRLRSTESCQGFPQVRASPSALRAAVDAAVSWRRG
jgi:hypothetical protein